MSAHHRPSVESRGGRHGFPPQRDPALRRARRRRCSGRRASFVLLALLAPIAGHAATPAASEPKAAAANAEAPDAERFFQSIVKVRARAVPNARSSATLGQEREGTGVVIGDDGLIVTIGYLIVEADEVSLVDQQGRIAAGARGRATTMRRDWASCAPSCR